MFKMFKFLDARRMFLKPEPVVMPQKVSPEAEIFLRAAKLLEKRGIAYNTASTSRGELCVGSAILLAGGGSWTTDDIMMTRLFRLFMEHSGLHYHKNPASWNDNHRPTKEEAVAVLRRVASKL